MGRNLEPKSKQERREGMKLGLKGEKGLSAKSPVVKRPYPPGMHGPASKKGHRLSGYGIRLREKQKAKAIYRLLEKEFRGYFMKANKQAGDTSENLLRLLETRLDNAVYRLGLAVSRDQARQLVNHGHFLVNGKPVTIPGYILKVGQKIVIKPVYLGKPFWQERLPKLAKAERPGWLSFDLSNYEGQMVSRPEKNDLIVPFDPTFIIEFYSR